MDDTDPDLAKARMTEDSDLWEQMVGRGGRPAAGIVLSGEHGKHSLCDIGDLDEEATAILTRHAADWAKIDRAKSLLILGLDQMCCGDTSAAHLNFISATNELVDLGND